MDGTNGEACDDGNTLSGDGCSSLCVMEVSVCGNGTQEFDETCDDGNLVTEECAYGAASCEVCDSVCEFVAGAVHVCGDLTTDLGEETCDEGDTITEICAYGETTCQVCNATCQDVPGATSFCGDLTKDEGNGETCDDGNTVSGDGCSASCVLEVSVCGNGIPEFDEECDDSNTVTEECLYGEASCQVCDSVCDFVGGAVHVCGVSGIKASSESEFEPLAIGMFSPRPNVLNWSTQL